MESTYGLLPGQVWRVSNELVDLSYAYAAHAEQNLTGPSGSDRRKFHCIDEDILVAGQIDDSDATLSEIQVPPGPSHTIHATSQRAPGARLNKQERWQRLGIKTVLNIRVANEQGFMDIAEKLQAAGVSYAHCPINYGKPSERDVDHLLGLLDACAKPCLLFCQVGLRAAAMGVTFKTVRRRTAMALNGSLGSPAADLMELVGHDNAKLLDDFCSLEAPEDSQLKAFIASYISSKVKNCINRPGASKICDNVYLTGQLSEEELRDYATAKGCKSVLNLRELCEAGQFGLGMLAKEREVVEGLGLKYVNVPVPREGSYSLELCKQVSDALQSLLASASPVVVHCRTGASRSRLAFCCLSLSKLSRVR